MQVYAVIITSVEEFEDYTNIYDDDIFDSDDISTMRFESDKIYGIFNTFEKAQTAKTNFENTNHDSDDYANIATYTINQIEEL